MSAETAQPSKASTHDALHASIRARAPPPNVTAANGSLVSAFAWLHDLKLVAETHRAVVEDLAAGLLDRGRHGQDVLWQLLVQETWSERQLDALRREFHEAFYNASTGRYGHGTQTELGLALWLHAVPPELQGAVLGALVADVAAHGYHTTSGVVGTKFVLEALTDGGRGDVALRMALQKTSPSFGAMVRDEHEPATTLWELWDASTSNGTMNSRNHVFRSSVDSWSVCTLPTGCLRKRDGDAWGQREHIADCDRAGFSSTSPASHLLHVATCVCG